MCARYVATEDEWGNTVIERQDPVGGAAAFAALTLGLLAVGGGIMERFKRSNANALIEKAFKAAEEGNYQEAVANATRAAAMYPDDVEPYIVRGTFHWAWQNHNDALTDFSKAISIDDKRSDAYVFRGKCHLEIGNLKDALSDLTHAIRRDAGQHLGYLYRGVALREIGDLSLALDSFNIAIDVDPSDEEGYRERAITYANIHDYHRAIADITCALKLNTNSSEDYRLRGELYRLVDDEEKANADFERQREIAEAFEKARSEKALAAQLATKVKNPFQATYSCSNCDHVVEADAKTCPHCGRVFRD